MPTRALILSFCLAPLLALAAKVPPQPPTPKKPVVETIFGHKVVDDYRWLENWNDPAVKKWSEAENARARAVLDALPNRAAIEKRVTEVLSWQSPSYRVLVYRGGNLFALKQQPPRQQPFIVLAGSLEDPSQEKVLVDPNAMDPTGGTSIDWFVPSLDGKRLAVSLSRGGTESGEVHLYDVATDKPIADVIPRVNSGVAGGSLAWNANGSGFWYTHHPEKVPGNPPAGAYQQIYFHALGAPPEKDAYSLGKDFPPNAEAQLTSGEDGARVAALVQKGDGGEYELFLLDPANNTWTKVAAYADLLKDAQLGPDGAVWAISRKGQGRGQLLRIPFATPKMEAAQVVVPEQQGAIDEYRVTPGRIYVIEQQGGPTRLRVFDHSGKELGAVATPPVSTAGGLTHLTGDDVAFAVTSFTTPQAWHRYDAKSGKAAKTALAQTSPVDLSFVEVVREEATSKDGTKVPYTVLRPKGTALDAKNPTLLNGYGGFGISSTPGFNRIFAVWLEQGGVAAVANIRGGGEFGERWHQEGMKTKKQNCFDDFIAVSRDLLARKYTDAKHLAIEGGSNGGLLMGAVMTQAPELYAAVLAQVGYFDMLRYETRPNGAFNATEYGTVKDKADFEALLAYSPYHHVQKGVKYPPSLLTTGANDPRVDPLHSRKMVAALQAAGATALLRTSGSTGHGIFSPLKERIAESVDSFAFLFDQVGVSFKPKQTAPAPQPAQKP